MSKSIILAIVGIIIFAAIGFFILKPEQSQKVMQDIAQTVSTSVSDRDAIDPVTDNRASFVIFTSGLRRDFSGAMYHNLSEDAYITTDAPNIIFIKRQDITWDQFFSTLPFKLTTECLWTGIGESFCDGQGGSLGFYLNGEKTDNLLEKIIQNGDQVLVTFGNETQIQIRNQIDQVPTP